MNAIEESKIPESVHNHLNYINNSNGKIKFLELFFNIKLRWHQKLYLKLYLLNHDCKQLDKLIQFIETSSKRR